MESDATAKGLSQRLRDLRDRMTSELFDQGGLKVLFQHASNVLAGTVVLTCGLHAGQHPERLAGLTAWTAHHTGYAVAALGFVLLSLNLWDGMRRLTRRQYPLAFRLLAGTAHVVLSLRLVEAVALFRGAM